LPKIITFRENFVRKNSQPEKIDQKKIIYYWKNSNLKAWLNNIYLRKKFTNRASYASFERYFPPRLYIYKEY